MTAQPDARPTPKLDRDRQLELYRRALKTLPGGTDSNFRAWGEDTIYVDRGKGGEVWDIDGNGFVDLRMGYGPVILGHGDERVDDYVNERMRRGVSFSLTSEDEVQAMELVKELTGWVDKVRMTVSGTEATMHAMRVARAYTGRDKIVKFEGQYHGVHDYALISVAPNNMADLGDADKPVGLAWGRGIPGPVADTIIPARYNDIERAAARCSSAQGEEIAAIIVEPVLGNAQGIMPKPGFHQAMRALTQEFGILLIFDEVKTGLPLRQGRRRRVLRHQAGPRDLRQGDGQRLPGGRVRRHRGGHEHAARQGQPRRHVRRQPGRGRRRGRQALGSCATRMRSRPSTPPAGGSRTASRRSSTRRACRTTSPATRRCSGSCSRRTVATEYRDWANTDHELYDAIAVGMHARGAMPEPDSPRAVVHVRGPRPGRPGGPGRLTAFSDSLDAALEARAHGERAPQPHGGMSAPGDD